MIYLDIPYKKHVLRAIAKKHGAIWNNFIKLWEIENAVEESQIPRKLKRYIVFNEEDLSSYKNVIKSSNKGKSAYTELSVKDVKFLQAYMKTKGDVKQAAVITGFKAGSGNSILKRIVAKPAAQQWLAAENEKLSAQARWEFGEKLAMLKQIAVTAVPIEAVEIKDMAPEHAIRAISEANKMQGHYCAEKHVNVNFEIDADVQAIQKLSSQLLDKHRKSY
jgi:phage terminase small subunit